jgi:Asp/Glu/Hydantoin racemase
MKRIGVLGGISAQATMDFEMRVHRASQRLIPQHCNEGYPPMVVWYHRRPPVRVHDDGRPYEPREVDPELVEAARWLGKVADFIVIPCNAAHVGAAVIRDAAGCPVLSMIDLVIDDVERQGLSSPSTADGMPEFLTQPTSSENLAGPGGCRDDAAPPPCARSQWRAISSRRAIQAPPRSRTCRSTRSYRIRRADLRRPADGRPPG